MITEQLVKRIAKIIFKKGGISCSVNNLVKAIKAGIKETHSPTALAFLKLLEKNDQQSKKTLETLIKYLTQQGFSFFQPDYLFELLKEEILPALIDNYSNLKKTLKIWNIECKTGEGIYSLAIILNEFLPLDSANIELLATDNNEFNLQQAKKGIYQDWALRKVPFDILSKYFSPGGNGYQIKEKIKNFINFSKLDITNDLYPSNTDLIFSPEGYYYSGLESSLKEEIFERLYASLKVHGYLFIDSFDIPEHIVNRMQPLIYPEGVVYQKIKKTGKQKPCQYIVDEIVESEEPLRETSDAKEKSIQLPQEQETETKLKPIIITNAAKKEIIIEPECALNDLEWAIEVIKKEIIIEQESMNNQSDTINVCNKNNLEELEVLLKDDPYNKTLMWEFIKKLWDAGELLKAKDYCERLLSLYPLNPDAQYMMGSIFEELGEPGQAMRAYEKLITIKPESVIAYFSIGCLANQLQQPKKALKYFRHTQSMLNNQDNPLNVEFAEHMKVYDLNCIVTSKIAELSL